MLSQRTFSLYCEYFASGVIENLRYRASIVSPPEETHNNYGPNVEFFITKHDSVQIQKPLGFYRRYLYLSLTNTKTVLTPVKQTKE